MTLQAQSNKAESGQSTDAQSDQYYPPCGGPDGCPGGYGPGMGRWGGPGMRGRWGGPGMGWGPAMGRGWMPGPGPRAASVWDPKEQAQDIGKQLSLNAQQTEKLQAILEKPWTVGPRSGVWTPKQRAELISKQLNLKSEQTAKLQTILENQGPGYGCRGWRWAQARSSGS